MKLLKSGLTVSLYTFLSRIAGFIREIFIADILAIGMMADCFNVALKLPNFFRRFFAEGAFNSAFIPIFSNKLSKDSPEDTKDFSNKIFTILTIMLILFILILEIFMPKIVVILAPGFKNYPEYYFNLAVNFSRICMPYLFFISLVALYGGILNSHRKFAASAFVPVLLNLTIISILIIFSKKAQNPAYILSYSIFIAGIIQFSFMFMILKKHKFLPKFTKLTIDSDVKKMFKNMGPAIISGGLSQLNLIVDTIVASNIIGAITSLSYADKIINLPVSLIGTTTTIILLPELAKYSKNDDQKLIKQQSFRIISLIIFPLTSLLIALPYEITSIIYQRGLFTAQDSLRVSNIVHILAYSLPAFILCKIHISSFFAIGDTKTPLKISMVTISTNIILDILLVKNYGAEGVAFASSFSGWVGFILYSIVSSRKKLFSYEKSLYIYITKVIILSLVIYFFILYMAKYLNIFLSSEKTITKLFTLLSLLSLSTLLYVILASFLNLLNIRYRKISKIVGGQL